MPRRVQFYSPERVTPQQAVSESRSPILEALLANKGDTRPAYGGVWEGVARVGSQIADAFAAKKLNEQEEERRNAIRETMTRALFGEPVDPAEHGEGITSQPITMESGVPDVVRTPTSRDKMARILAGNPDTANMSFQMKLADMEAQRQAQAEAAADAAAHQRAIELKQTAPGRAPVPGTDTPLPDEVVKQRMAMALAGKGAGGPEIGSFNPRDYTADSFAKFMESKDPTVLERYQRYKQIGGKLWDVVEGKPVADVTDALRAGKQAEAEGTVAGKGEITPREQMTKGRERLSDTLETMVSSYLKLDEMGAIVNPDRGAVENLEARARSSGPGQLYGGAVGSEAQSIRRRIVNAQPILIQQIRQATGMSARGMDSNRELQFYLQSATDPTTGDIYSNLVAIQVLDDTFGLGGILERTLPPETLARIKEQAALERARRPITITPDQTEGGSGKPVAPAAAVQYLRQNPQFADQFDAKYGPGAAQRVLEAR